MDKEGNLTVQDVMNHPDLAKYVKNWGLKNDMGFVATLANSNERIGSAWLRLLTKEN